MKDKGSLSTISESEEFVFDNSRSTANNDNKNALAAPYAKELSENEKNVRNNLFILMFEYRILDLRS